MGIVDANCRPYAWYERYARWLFNPDKGGQYLFSLRPDLTQDLPQTTDDPTGQVPERLKDEFAQHGQPLTDQAQVRVNQTQPRWTITDTRDDGR